MYVLASMIPENKYYSYNIGKLPKGCQFCVKGEKLVLFITGICPRKCVFCPVSDEKYQKDVIYANERQSESCEAEVALKAVMYEAELMGAKGAGITGGDPLCALERTADFIKALKKKFGKEFHIHLYTSLNLVNEKSLKILFDAGLDEIRFHLDLDSDKLWSRVNLAKALSWDVGVEVPIIPEKIETLKKMLSFIHDKVDFVNLNELEFADNKHSKLGDSGYVCKDEVSYAVKGSVNIGLELLDYVKKKRYDVPMHLCTAKLKDAVQLSNRIKRESENVQKPFDIVDEEGMLIRGAIYPKDLAPGVGYRNKLKKSNKEQFILELKPKLEKLIDFLEIDKEGIFLDKEKPRILLSAEILEYVEVIEKIKELDLVPTIVTEYPTADQLEIEVELL